MTSTETPDLSALIPREASMAVGVSEPSGEIMTTKVLVDAHAGWPVKVEAIDTYDDKVTQTEIATVPPGQKLEFYATSSRQILVTEVKKPEA